jgi:large subunit ribosomal protein L13e
VRQKKAVAVFPRPTAGPLRPAVPSQTLKYNSKIRGGQGFTLEELKVSFFVAQKVPDFWVNECLF